MADWEGRLTAEGHRITAPRRAIMEVLERTEAPLPPQEILDRAQGRHPELGLVTVYRTLRLLAELHLVRRVHQEDGCHGYVAGSPGQRHALVCRSCGKAVEFVGGEALTDLVRRVEQRTGYRVESHLLQLFGTCADCQDRNA